MSRGANGSRRPMRARLLRCSCEVKMPHELSFDDTILLAKLTRKHKKSQDTSFTLKRSILGFNLCLKKKDSTGAIDRLIDAGYIKEVTRTTKDNARSSEKLNAGKVEDLSYEITITGYEACLDACDRYRWSELSFVLSCFALVVSVASIAIAVGISSISTVFAAATPGISPSVKNVLVDLSGALSSASQLSVGLASGITAVLILLLVYRAWTFCDPKVPVELRINGKAA